MPVYIPEGDYMPVPEAAERAGVNVQRIRQLCGSGQLCAIRIGDGQMGVWLIPVGGLDDWITTRQTGRPKAYEKR